MCELTLVNLKSPQLNQLALLVLTQVGSVANDDGWGYVAEDGEHLKCEHPAYKTTNAGSLLSGATALMPMLGHVRAASGGIPVEKANSHPFVKTSQKRRVFFMHNGSLKPKDESKFVLTKDVEKINTYNVKITDHIRISDSRIFFDHFSSKFKMSDSDDLDNVFVQTLVDTMNDFSGKFAFLFYFLPEKKYYVVRGKTAQLHISYMMSAPTKAGKVLGYIVNTSKDTLAFSTALMSNISQLQGNGPLYFSIPEEIDKETIFTAQEFGLEKIGEVKETYPVHVSNFTRFPNTTGTPIGGGHQTNIVHMPAQTSDSVPAGLTELTGDLLSGTRAVYDLMTDYSLGPQDIQMLFIFLYGTSLVEINEEILNHFTSKVIPLLKSRIARRDRDKVKELCNSLFPSRYYWENSLEFPWFINTLDIQQSVIKALEDEKKAQGYI